MTDEIHMDDIPSHYRHNNRIQPWLEALNSRPMRVRGHPEYTPELVPEPQRVYKLADDDKGHARKLSDAPVVNDRAFFVDKVYQEFQEQYGFVNLTPPPLNLEKHILNMKGLKQSTERFCRDPVNVMTEKHFLVKRFYNGLVTEARTVFQFVRRDLDGCLKSALTPISGQLKEHHATKRQQRDYSTGSSTFPAPSPMDDSNVAPEHSAAMTLGMLSSGGMTPNSANMFETRYPPSMANLLNEPVTQPVANLAPTFGGVPNGPTNGASNGPENAPSPFSNLFGTNLGGFQAMDLPNTDSIDWVSRLWSCCHRELF